MTEMTWERLSPSICAGLQSMSACTAAGPKSKASPAVLALVDYVERKGPVTVRDVQMRFGLTAPGARKRLKAAGEQLEEGPDGWRVAT